MLTEFALTPSIFDAALHPNAGEWQEQLRELGQGMFPRVAASPVIVSNLHGGAWEGVAGGTIARLRDPRVRNLCQGLLTRLAAAFVRRPVRGGTPGTELQWAQAALAFRTEEPIERIVVTEAAKADTLADEGSVFALRHVHDEAFWAGILSAGPQEMVVATQVGRLSKLCKHADFLLLVSKDIHGGDDDETRFAVELIQSALSRPPGFGVPEVEVHTQGPDLDPRAPAYSATLHTVVSNIRQSLRAALRPGQQVRLVMWAKLLDRLVIAGSSTRGSAGKTTRRPRWGVAMSHIARPGDVRKGHPPTNWSLLQSADLGEKFARYEKRGVPSLKLTETIRG
jgi:hypothetical protein